jgi:glycerophosphoryl diester phosphodiesterase
MRACNVSTAALLAILAYEAFATGTQSSSSKKMLIAHRGASAYAPEHTLAAYRLAMEQGADFVEQDLALTKDGVLVCLHDPTLERTTDVEERFPDRSTSYTGGGVTRKVWLVNDFTLAEIKTLDAGSWFNAKFAGERVPSFQEAIDLVRGKAGFFPELKLASLYNSRGASLEKAVAEALARNGLARPDRANPSVILQSFEADSLRELATLLPDVPRVLLVEPASADRWLGSAASIRKVAEFAWGIGPNKAILEARPSVVAWAHEAGLRVTPWTFRSSSTGRFGNVREEMAHHLYSLGADGVFTDNPDQFPK